MGRSRRTRRYAVGQEPWLLREHGGAPTWLILAAVLVLAGIAVFCFAAVTG